jgi:hypothetical protein
VRATGFGTPEVDAHLRDKFDGMIRSGRRIVIAMISGGLKVANPLCEPTAHRLLVSASASLTVCRLQPASASLTILAELDAPP